MLPFVFIFFIIALILYFVFAGRKKEKGSDAGEVRK